MKTYGQLTPVQQVRAMKLAMETLVESVLEGVVKIRPILKQNREAMEKILFHAKKSEHHTFAKEFILEDRELSVEFKILAKAVVEGSYYTDEGVIVMDQTMNERAGNV